MMYIVHTGIDLVEISRIQRLIDSSGSRFLSKHFTDTEIDYCSRKGQAHFAGLFAIKEAVYKALKLRWTREFNWKNIETIHSPDGIPEIKLYESFKEHYENHNYMNIDISLSYAGDYALASVAVLQLQS